MDYDKNMYAFPSRVRFSETDQAGEVKLYEILNYLQDCATFQTEDVGAGLNYMQQHHMAWMVSAWHIKILRYPSLGEEILIGTLPYKLKGVLGYRNFVMDTQKGERLVSAASLWTLVDTQKGLPMRIPETLKEKYPLCMPLEETFGSRKIRLSEDEVFEKQKPFSVQSHHMDSNQHVNNGKYIEIAQTFLPEGATHPDEVRIEYKKQARLGDRIVPMRNKTERNGQEIFTVSLENEEGEKYCVTEFIFHCRERNKRCLEEQYMNKWQTSSGKSS